MVACVVGQIVPHLFVLLQQAIAFFTLCTETSLLTKDVLQDVPEVEVRHSSSMREGRFRGAVGGHLDMCGG